MLKNKNILYWSIVGTVTLSLIGFILYLIFRPYSHKPEEGIENDNSLNTNNMLKQDNRYDLKVRGYRNNNPLNIRISNNNWKGEIKPSGDKSFCQFKSMAYGFRAAMCCIRTYIRLHNAKTLKAIIDRWAPLKDGNNPTRYAQRVMNRFPDVFTSKDVVIDYTNMDQMTKLVYAMAIVENGSEPIMEDCITAFSLM